MSKPRVVMGGSRSWTDEAAIRVVMQELRSALGDFVVVYGAHWEGADLLLKTVAERMGLEIDPYPADWKKYRRPNGKNPAGQIRNREMVRSNVVAYVGFWDGKSPGTAGAAAYAVEAGVPVSLIGPRQRGLMLSFLRGGNVKDQDAHRARAGA